MAKATSAQKTLKFSPPPGGETRAKSNGNAADGHLNGAGSNGVTANGSAGSAATNGDVHIDHHAHATKRRATAESMATKQRDISVSEFFAKNRHLLGFDNPRKALLTTVKE